MVAYVPAAISLIVALVAILAKTKNDDAAGLRRVRPFGWLLVSLALASFGLATYSTWTSGLIESSTYSLLAPYLLITDPPESEDRFKLSESLLQAGVYDAFCDINPYEPAYNTGFSWASLLTDHTASAMSRLGDELSRYQTVLSSGTVEHIARIRTSRWVEHMLILGDYELRRKRSGAGRSTTTMCGSGSRRARCPAYRGTVDARTRCGPHRHHRRGHRARRQSAEAARNLRVV